mmetsp:Transcript_36891/g.67590  ORF Transcript_36891/g.67590 Transcript_36891/m.67590 type:complete len:80 (+) Transcript_36891:3-242(+)
MLSLVCSSGKQSDPLLPSDPDLANPIADRMRRFLDLWIEQLHLKALGSQQRLGFHHYHARGIRWTGERPALLDVVKPTQ